MKYRLIVDIYWCALSATRCWDIYNHTCQKYSRSKNFSKSFLSELTGMRPHPPRSATVCSVCSWYSIVMSCVFISCYCCLRCLWNVFAQTVDTRIFFSVLFWCFLCFVFYFVCLYFFASSYLADLCNNCRDDRLCSESYGLFFSA